MLRTWWPEVMIGACALFFFVRELGTFPEAWQDDSLFMIVARNLAEGRGYAIPVLDRLWHGSYFLAVGPTVIAPSALMIRLFDFSVAIARIPMVLYLAATTVALYAYALHIGGRTNARWAAALLISLSAFVNTGKPVLGEVPGIFFLLLGLLAFDRGLHSRHWAALCGVAFGLAFVTKTTMGLLFPALGIVWLSAVIGRRREWVSLTVMGAVAGLIIAPFLPILGMTDPGWVAEILQYGAAEGGTTVLRVLWEQPALLLRFQYLYALGLLLPLSCIGLMRARTRIARSHILFIAVLIGLFVLYFLNERGYYRHLLLAHLLFLPFVPAGIFAVVQQRIGVVILAAFVAAQGLWQLDHRGSRRLNEAIPVAALLEAQYRDVRLVIEQPEVFVRLSANPHWMFLSEEFRMRSYDRFPDLPKTQTDHCLPLLQKMGGAEQAMYPPESLIDLGHRYVIRKPPADCGKPYESPQ